ncbi:cyclic peptide export ABC transporter [Burkholderia gladioli]|uniref:cyclic peptide export ABC transporter n=1 Tax=Burkholderia gladioli TaxID=28095 RepID=UPI002657042B|nr:cyclic peptide export ABC transporter [Burkholderia gladioli]MDN7749303.1 cyclic peptide export ABC transporter [Burkholderia gladioli]
MKVLMYLYRQSPRLMVLVTLTSLIGGLASAGMATVTSRSIAPGTSLLGNALAFFGLCAVQLAFRSWSEVALVRLTQSMMMRLRVTLSQRLLDTPQEKLQRLGKSDLFVILTRDIDTFSQTAQLLPMMFGNLIVIGGCLAYLAWISWQLCAIFLACVAAGMVLYPLAERVPLEKLRVVREQTDVMYRHFRGLIDGSKELQLNERRARHFIGAILSPGLERFRGASVDGMRNYIWVANGGALLFYLVIGVVVFVTPLWLPLPITVRATSALLGLYLISPVTATINGLPMLRQADISLRRIEQIASTLDALPPPDDAFRPFDRDGPLRLELRGVEHVFEDAGDDTRFTLGPIDLEVDQGEVLFLVGGNGSGKTTLAMLLLGLYEPSAGSIALNGVPLTRERLAAYRRHFSAVFSDFHLFEHLPDTGRPDAAQAAAHYVERLGLAHKVRIEDGRYSTIELSTGQRKRLALVSAYTEDRPIYLFDEWAADQDPAFKRVFYTELLPELKRRGKTVIVITHDDAYFDCADRVIKLRDGLAPAAAASAPRAASVPPPEAASLARATGLAENEAG